MRSNVGTVLVAIGTLQVNMARPSDTAQILADISYEVGAISATSAEHDRSSAAQNRGNEQ